MKTQFSTVGVLLSISQVIQAGLRRHFQSAKFPEPPSIDPGGSFVTFETYLLGMRLRVSVTRLSGEPGAAGSTDGDT